MTKAKFYTLSALIFLSILLLGSRTRDNTELNVSDLNVSTTPLAAGATWTGTWELVGNRDTVVAYAKSDVAGTMYMEFCKDQSCTTADSSLSFEVAAGINEVHRLTITRPYFRLRYTNGSTDQTTFQTGATYGAHPVLSAPHNLTIGQDADTVLVSMFDSEVDIATGRFAGQFLVKKFGRNTDVDAAEDITAAGGDYAGFPTGSAEAVELLSSSTDDTSAGIGCRTVKIFGLDASYNLQEETVSLSGTTPVDSAGTYARVNRAYCVTAGTATTNVGIITIRHTTTVANVFGTIQAGVGQTKIAVYTVPASHTCYLERYSATMGDNTANKAALVFWMRPDGGAVRLQRDFIVSTNYNSDIRLYGAVAFSAKTDLKVRVTSIQNANGDITATFSLVCIKQAS